MTDSAGPALVGRETELAVLRHRLAQAGERGPRVVLVTGPSGAGSTALVRRLAAEHVAAGGRCLQAGAVPWEQDVTHGVLSQLVGRAVTATRSMSLFGRRPPSVAEPWRYTPSRSSPSRSRTTATTRSACSSIDPLLVACRPRTIRHGPVR